MQQTEQQQLPAVSRATWRQVSAERRARPDERSIAWAIDSAGSELVRDLLDDPAPFALLAARAAERADPDSDAELALCLLAAAGGQRTRAAWSSCHQRTGRSRGRRRSIRGGESGFATAVADLRAGLAGLGQQAAA